MEQHWHAYSYTGPGRPKDSDARNAATATPPLTIREWMDKPRSMHAGVFAAPADAVAWLEQQLAAIPPMVTALPADALVGYARERLTGAPGDVVTRYYTASAYVARDLIRCGPDVRCPGRP